jgi:Uma2 family endonuclease
MHRRLGQRLLGWEDYAAIPSDGRRHEILEGDWYMTPPPFAKHQWVSRNLETILWAHVRALNLGVVLDAPLDVILDEHTIVQPDLIFIAQTRREIICNQIQGAPDLVVEIASPSTHALERGLRYQIYARHGVANYWIVDPGPELLDEFRLAADGGYDLVSRHEGAATVRPALFPGLEFPLVDLWRL